ncbi:hypothetical protein, partial [Leptospira weilii]|uniref:hypothetical protein n=1 Tax=Leptospira weilii TaxID=28184 RepID=UPI001F308091
FWPVTLSLTASPNAYPFVLFFVSILTAKFGNSLSYIHIFESSHHPATSVPVHYCEPENPVFTRYVPRTTYFTF